jgi:hypothetical protein
VLDHVADALAHCRHTDIVVELVELIRHGEQFGFSSGEHFL